MQIRIWRVLLQILQLGQDTLVCSVINDWRSQNGARASVTQTTAPLIPLFCSYHILISSTIYYWTDARKYEIYLLKRHQVIVAFYAIHLAKQSQWTEYTLCSSDIQQYSHCIYPISDTSTLTKIYHRTHTLLKWNISSHLKGLTVVILEKKIGHTFTDTFEANNWQILQGVNILLTRLVTSLTNHPSPESSTWHQHLALPWQK